MTHRNVAGAEGVELAVVEVGDQGAPAAVVAHGAGSSARFVVAAFSDAAVAAGLRLVTYDLRGHGTSTRVRGPAGHTLDLQVADLDAVLASVGGEVAVVGGVSVGAHAAVRWAARSAWRDGTVVACLPAWLGRGVRGGGVHALVAAELHESGAAGVIERLRADPTLPAWLRTSLVADYERHDPASLAAALIALDGAEAPGDDELACLAAPLVVVAWPGDPFHPIDVARQWCEAASSAGRPAGVASVPAVRLVTLEMTDLDDGVAALGRAALSPPHTSA